ncbi:hypothetical protein BDV96DRAFT_592463 [Lophiotrema nucula]|uniref:AAA+ ATPase domain-containing protein n=1 Tax=Lophiotrema nucula TaxID=690887 RepID=A0A6A5YGJ9_9PLEO|nr:hypothetical protein BDV96DRAFT_592463 [Lophiotrema nucula]
MRSPFTSDVILSSATSMMSDAVLQNTSSKDIRPALNSDHDPDHDHRLIEYFTVSELRLFCSDDPRHHDDYDENSDIQLEGEGSDSVPDSLIDGLDNIELTVEDLYPPGEICELHVYEIRYNSRGEKVTLQVDATEDLDIPIDRSTDAALVLFRIYDSTKTLQSTSLEIRSTHMRFILREVIKSYPGVNLDSTGFVTIQGTPRCLFHYRREIQAFAEESEDEDVKEHATFLLRYMRRTLEKELAAYETYMESNDKDPGMEFGNLWMAFKPGDLIYREVHGEPSLYRLRSMTLKRPQLATMSPPGVPPPPLGGTHQLYDAPPGLPSLPSDQWRFQMDLIQCDGENFGYSTTPVVIGSFEGYRALRDLAIFPFEHHPEKQVVRRNLLTRGKFYLSLTGIHHMVFHYVPLSTHRDTDSESETIYSRVIVDCEQFYASMSTSVAFNPGSKLINSKAGDHMELAEEDILICPHEIPGFSLDGKKWTNYKLKGLKDIKFDHAAFQSLVLPRHQKDLIQSLVKEHQSKQLSFDDLIKGKGNGLIFLLHGEPGVGKTLTAESIAELTERPLYTIGCGDLGTHSSNVERAITSTLTLAYRWNSLVLLDEADVFMEQRSSQELNRNELVSVLLRVLEYSNCIMFLTTNRISSIDTAFKSRVHLALYYPRLSVQARRQIWDVFLARALGTKTPKWLDRRFRAKVASYEINGRQIKNIMRMSCAMATNNQRELQRQDILNSLGALISFEKNFERPESKDSNSFLNLLAYFLFFTFLFISMCIAVTLQRGEWDRVVFASWAYLSKGLLKAT